MLLSNLDLLATAPGGVAKLRELILTLAVQGKLVPQEPADEPASRLLQNIRAEKDRLIAEGKIKRDKPLAVIVEDEKPFELPEGWEWSRLGSLASKLTDGSHNPPRDSGAGYPMLSSQNVREGGIIDFTSPTRYVDEADFLIENSRTTAAPGDVLLTIVASLGRSAVVPNGAPEFVLQRSVAVIRSGLNSAFCSLYLRAPIARAYYDLHGKGTAQKGIYLGKLGAMLIAVPPLAEQSRIVTRVEALMRLCDALEAKGQLEAAQHAQLVSTLLGTLTTSTTAEELADNWQRVAQHFDLLLDRPEAIDALEQTLLQLAVRGLLVPQDPTDEPASVLLQRIRAEKNRLLAEGKIKRDKPRVEPAVAVEAFTTPAGWTWACFQDLCTISGGATPSKADPRNWDGTIPWVSPKDMKVSQISDAQDHISEAAVRGSLALIPSGSLLVVVRGMILVHSFPVAETLVPVTINQDMKALTPHVPATLPFLALICKGMKLEILSLVDRSTHGTCKLESPKLFGLPLPVPPLAEQARIVARVESLRRLCADLRQRLAERQSVQARLAEALLQAA
ncbi:restriction endonuclease subunit S [Acidovorax sp. JHL-9]|uniref:restriction endonuclease subunit S n=1 Tax=Acidovorax sp. JHL-9 TaxID=1276756 RepID=UPI0003FCD3D2|nr:restriction endonuclease subunit S [Acidovorax sp. JHL-9]